MNFSGSGTVVMLFINGVQQPRGKWNAARDATHFTGNGSLVVTSGPDPVGDGVWSSSTSGDWSAAGNWQDTLLANGTDKTGSNALTLDVTTGKPQVSVGPGVTATIPQDTATAKFARLRATVSP